MKPWRTTLRVLSDALLLTLTCDTPLRILGFALEMAEGGPVPPV